MARRKKKLRTHRGKMNTDRMIKAGNKRFRALVYGYQFPSRRDIMKIGYSSRGLVRVREQSTGFPETPDILFVIHAKNADDIEKRIHKDLARHQVDDVMGTEWFSVDVDDVVGVSPELRKALGRQRWKSPWRWLLMMVSLCFSFAMMPLFELWQEVAAGRLTVAEALEWTKGYARVFASVEASGYGYLVRTVHEVLYIANTFSWMCLAGLIGVFVWLVFRWR